MKTEHLDLRVGKDKRNSTWTFGYAQKKFLQIYMFNATLN